MASAGIDILFIPSPENMYYLTGYDGWSFYLDQGILLDVEEGSPIWIGRASDINVARASPVIEQDNVHAYGDEYLQSTTLTPYDFVADVIEKRGWDKLNLAIPMDSYHLPVGAYTTFVRRFSEGQILDDKGVVNWLRAIKSADEVGLIKTAAQIAEGAFAEAASTVRAGQRRADTAAAIMHSVIGAIDDETGNYAALGPLIIDGDGPARPHTTWSSDPYVKGGTYILEFAGVYKRYHCPIARTISIGKPSAERKAGVAAQAACLKMLEEKLRPGVRCSEIAELCRDTIEGYGFSKAGRFGYSTGIAYPPDWGEHTVSIRTGEETRIEAGMTLFFIPALWGEESSVAIGETFYVSEEGARPMTTVPYDLLTV